MKRIIKIMMIVVMSSLINFTPAMANDTNDMSENKDVIREVAEELDTQNIDGSSIIEAINNIKDIKVEKQESTKEENIDVLSNLKEIYKNFINGILKFLKSNLLYIFILIILSSLLLIKKYKYKRRR